MFRAFLDPRDISTATVPRSSNRLLKDIWGPWGAGNDGYLRVLLARKDRKDLKRKDVELLHSWLEERVIPKLKRPVLRWDASGLLVFPHPEDARLLTKERFHKYWHGWEKRRLKAPHKLPCGHVFEGYTRPKCPYNVREQRHRVG